MKFFQKYLSVWVILCMIIGVSIGHFFPMIPNILNKFEYAGISIPNVTSFLRVALKKTRKKTCKKKSKKICF